MKKALQNLELSTLDFLRSYFRQIQTFYEANNSLVQICGINDFFGNEHDFTTFLEFLEPRHIVS
ncbi:MAG: hypothetical protein NUV74_03970, partial [Candidatus Brocadiaceae bacterium]|nr:hypothetical protein [Candidatus Brocadiaceae bacterium]